MQETSFLVDKTPNDQANTEQHYKILFLGITPLAFALLIGMLLVDKDVLRAFSPDHFPTHAQTTAQINTQSLNLPTLFNLYPLVFALLGGIAAWWYTKRQDSIQRENSEKLDSFISEISEVKYRTCSKEGCSPTHHLDLLPLLHSKDRSDVRLHLRGLQVNDYFSLAFTVAYLFLNSYIGGIILKSISFFVTSDKPHDWIEFLIAVVLYIANLWVFTTYSAKARTQNRKLFQHNRKLKVSEDFFSLVPSVGSRLSNHRKESRFPSWKVFLLLVIHMSSTAGFLSYAFKLNYLQFLQHYLLFTISTILFPSFAFIFIYLYQTGVGTYLLNRYSSRVLALGYYGFPIVPLLIFHVPIFSIQYIYFESALRNYRSHLTGFYIISIWLSALLTYVLVWIFLFADSKSKANNTAAIALCQFAKLLEKTHIERKQYLGKRRYHLPLKRGIMKLFGRIIKNG